MRFQELHILRDTLATMSLGTARKIKILRSIKGLNMLLRLRFRVGGLTDTHGYTRIDFVYSSP